MKKKIIICLICVLGLFVGLTTFAAEAQPPGLQNPSYSAASGYDLTNISDFVSGNTLTIPAGTEIYLYNNYAMDTENNTICILAANYDGESIFEEESSMWILYYDTDVNVLHFNNYYSTCEVDEDFHPGIKLTTTEIITGTYNYNLDNIYYYNFSAIVPEGNIAAEIITGTSTLVSSTGSMFVNIFAAAVGIVYNSNDGITAVGWLMLIGLGIALFMFGLRYIKGLINKVRSR